MELIIKKIIKTSKINKWVQLPPNNNNNQKSKDNNIDMENLLTILPFTLTHLFTIRLTLIIKKK